MQIQGLAQIHGAQPISGPHNVRQPQPAEATPTRPSGDQLEISDAARLAGRVSELPDIRADRVQSLRAAIASGTYETPEKLDIALERLLDEIG